MNAKEFKEYGEACYGKSWQAQVAEYIGVDRRRVSQWLKNDKTPDFVKIELKKLIKVRALEINEAMKLIEQLKEVK